MASSLASQPEGGRAFSRPLAGTLDATNPAAARASDPLSGHWCGTVCQVGFCCRFAARGDGSAARVLLTRRASSSGCGARSSGRGGGACWLGLGRVGTSWIGEPPHWCSRVVVAVHRIADGCPGLCACVPMVRSVVVMPAGLASAEAVSRRVDLTSSRSSPIARCSKKLVMVKRCRRSFPPTGSRRVHVRPRPRRRIARSWGRRDGETVATVGAARARRAR